MQRIVAFTFEKLRKKDEYFLDNLVAGPGVLCYHESNKNAGMKGVVMVVKGLSGVFANQTFPLNGVMIFGRNGSSCHVLFPDNTKGISRMHCKIELQGGRAMITDLGSSYGTFVNGLKIPQHVATPLNDGDSFYLGDQQNLFSFQMSDAEVPVASQGGQSNMTYSEENTPISMWGYVGWEIVFGLPLVGLILAIVFSFGGTRNINLKNFARGKFALWIIGIVIVLVFWLIIGASFGALLGGLTSFY